MIQECISTHSINTVLQPVTFSFHDILGVPTVSSHLGNYHLSCLTMPHSLAVDLDKNPVSSIINVLNFIKLINIV